MCVGIPGRIVAIADAATHQVIADVGGVRRQICVSCVMDRSKPAEALLGEWVLIHVGFAMSRIDAGEARRTLDLLNELGEAEAEMAALRKPVS